MKFTIVQRSTSALSAKSWLFAPLHCAGGFVGTILTAILITACANSTTSSPAQNAAPPSPAASPTELTLDSVGPIKLGMSLEEVSKTLSTPLVTLRQEPLPENIAQMPCEYVKPETGPLKDVELMVNQGKIVRVDIVQAGVKTATGIGLGSTQAEVQKAYPEEQLRVLPDRYLPTGKNLTVIVPGRPQERMIFEAENGVVTSIRIGRTPEVEWVERCS